MNILVLEDRPNVLKNMEELLTDMKYKVYSCQNIYVANEKLEENKIDCFIIDLAMSPEGLDNIELMEKTENGNFTGWVWVDEKVLKKNKNLKDRIIIFSAYVGEFESYMRQYNIPKDIFILSKGDPDCNKKLEDKLAELQQQLKS